MPKMPPPSKELEARVDRLLRSRPPTVKRPMFGCAAWFDPQNSQMCAGVYGDGLMVRVGAEAVQRWLGLDRASAFDPAGGRPMREYVYLEPERIRTGKRLGVWLDRALAFTATLPAKDRQASRSRSRR